jgi:hypothetical protein
VKEKRIMRKMSMISPLVLAALAVWGQGVAMWFPSAAASMDEAARFVAHPARCAQLLGHEHHDDGLPPAFHADLEAALDATGLSPERAIGQISSRCWQQLDQ